MTRALWRIGGSVVTVSLLAFGTLQVVSQVAYDRTTRTRDVTAAVRVVDVRIDRGSIDVEADPARTRVRLHRDVERGLADTTASERVVGDTLVVHASCPFLSAHCEARYRLDVPPDVRVVAHADGDVRIAGVHGDVDARASEGGVTLTDLTGTVDAHASEGSVHATGLHSSLVDASASEGGVSLVFATDPSRVVARSSEGSVHVVVPRDRAVYRVDAHASEGSTEVGVPTDPASGRRIAAHASQGDVSVTPGTGSP